MDINIKIFNLLKLAFSMRKTSHKLFSSLILVEVEEWG